MKQVCRDTGINRYPSISIDRAGLYSYSSHILYPKFDNRVHYVKRFDLEPLVLWVLKVEPVVSV